MAKCTYCGAENPEGSKFCSECGAPLAAPASAAPEFSAEQPTYTPPQNPYGTAQFTPPAQLPTGGLLVWAIISILLCMIPGIVALVQVLGINSAATAEQQQQRLSSAKTWCIVATVLGGLSLIANIIAVVFYGADYASRLIG